MREGSITALTLAADGIHEDRTTHWIWIKKLKLNPKIDLFWWRLYNNALPSNSLFVNRRISFFSGCPRGCEVVEDKDHIGGRCFKIRKVASLLNNWGLHIPVYECLEDCLGGLQKMLGREGLAANLYCTVLWLVWKSRCKLIYTGKEDSDNSIAANAISFAVQSNFLNFQQDNWDAYQLLLSSHWNPPPPGWIKINVDGALMKNNRARIGGVARDDKGRFLLAFDNPLQHWDAAQTELFAILFLKNVVKEWMFEAQGVIIEGDNRNIINFLQNSVKEWKVSKVIEDSLAFLIDFKQVIFSYSSRLGNKLADMCATMSLERSFLWEDLLENSIPPSFLHCLKEECDDLGIS
ncbi:Putative ribonuclease H protein [Dendrobium catenatum]|uniref:Ribonuclease H protein n=1 Tax=Dendrobium catenatum TaxID=906689 RepID=A0A2I0X2W3_9ASPA|nr:Putative ribonuclease H protein [Dendrobium catenatum]